MPFVVFGGLIALSPVAPERSELQEQAVRSAQQRGRDAKPFRYIPDDEVYALDLDPRRVRFGLLEGCLLYTSPSPRDRSLSRMPSSA